jgi:hypothetical protein
MMIACSCADYADERLHYPAFAGGILDRVVSIAHAVQEATPELQQAYYAGVVQKCENALLHVHVLHLATWVHAVLSLHVKSSEILRVLVMQLERHDENSRVLQL